MFYKVGDILEYIDEESSCYGTEGVVTEIIPQGETHVKYIIKGSCYTETTIQKGQKHPGFKIKNIKPSKELEKFFLPLYPD